MSDPLSPDHPSHHPQAPSHLAGLPHQPGEPGPKKLFKVLAIDGGGIRGIVPAKVLADLEARTGRPIAEQFDLVVGTSTGGIIALGLTKPDPNEPSRPQFSAGDMVDLYRERGADMFPRDFFTRVKNLVGPRYPAEPLETALKDYFGDTRLHESLTSVMVPAYDLEHRETVFMKHRRNFERGRDDQDFLMRDVARGTTAAPTYFPPALVHPVGAAKGKPDHYAMVDGGVFNNNPALSAYVEALKLAPKDEEVMVVSLGTGGAKEPIPYQEALGWGQIGWMHPGRGVPILDIVMDGQAQAAHNQMRYTLGDNYFRVTGDIDHKLRPSDPKTAMDAATPDNIGRLEDFADRVIAENEPALATIARRLEGDRQARALEAAAKQAQPATVQPVPVAGEAPRRRARI